jgi:hypothetical protein
MNLSYAQFSSPRLHFSQIVASDYEYTDHLKEVAQERCSSLMHGLSHAICHIKILYSPSKQLHIAKCMTSGNYINNVNKQMTLDFARSQCSLKNLSQMGNLCHCPEIIKKLQSVHPDNKKLSQK